MLIITGSDDNYVPGVLVLIASAAFHNPEARFAVLDMGISAVNRARIDQLARQLGCEINRIEVAPDAFDHLLIKRAHLTRSTYLRLLIPDYFPQEERVIYMDCDMVVTDSLAPAYEADLGTAPIAAVPCPNPNLTEVAATGQTLGTYINAGFLVMNLPVWRAENIAQQCVTLLSDAAHPLLSEDQSAINIVCGNRTVLLPSRFNVYADPTAYAQPEDLVQALAVIHYVVSNKPWNWPNTLGRVWQFHAQRIAGLMPPQQQLTLRRRVSILTWEGKMRLGTLLHRRKYLVRQRVAEIMNRDFTRQYLARVGGAKADS